MSCGRYQNERAISLNEISLRSLKGGTLLDKISENDIRRDLEIIIIRDQIQKNKAKSCK